MADAYRYPLTRICLRTGSLTLPLTLLGVFPERDDLVAYDPEKDAEFALRVEGRSVTGLEPFFAAHDLDVNDELSIRPLEDGRFAFTAIVRPKRPDYTRPDVVGKLLDAVVETGVPMSEAEIRATHADLPGGFPLRQALEREPRLALVDGRWRPAPAPASAATNAERPRATRGPSVPPRLPRTGADRGPRPDAAGAARRGGAGAARRRPDPSPASKEAAERRRRARQAEEDAAARAEVEAAIEAQAAREAEILELVRREELEGHVGDGAAAVDAAPARRRLGEETGESDAAGERRRSRERLAQHAEDDVRQAARDRRRQGADEGQESFGWDLPTPRGFRFPWSRKAPAKPAPAKPEPVVSNDPFRLDRLGEPRPVDRSAPPAARVTPSPRAGLFPEGAALNSATLPPGDPAKTKKARESFARLGYRVEGLAHGQLMLHADLGRRQERVLVHVLPDGQRLDWAALLARRREAGGAAARGRRRPPRPPSAGLAGRARQGDPLVVGGPRARGRVGRRPADRTVRPRAALRARRPLRVRARALRTRRRAPRAGARHLLDGARTARGAQGAVGVRPGRRGRGRRGAARPGACGSSSGSARRRCIW